VARANQTGARPDGGEELETLSQCSICGGRELAYIDKPNCICRCEHCGYVFDNPRPTLRAIVAFYSQMGKYDSWLAEEGNRDQLWKRRLKILKRHRISGSLLDVGTGTGQFLSIARESFTVLGTEVSESAVRIAKNKYGLDVKQGQVEDIHFDTRFDVITLFHVLEHVPNPLSTLRRCRELLNSDGILVVAVPNDLVGSKAIVKRLLALAGIGGFKGRRYGLGGIRLDGSPTEVHLLNFKPSRGFFLPNSPTTEIHLSHFTPTVLRRLVERSGLTAACEGLDPYTHATGIRKTADDVHFAICSFLLRFSGLNLYDTILVVAKAAESESTKPHVHQLGTENHGPDGKATR
jgi:SAM-dependent methyltransferase